MHHRLDYVAKSRHVDSAALVAYGNTNAGRYSILDPGPDGMVSTWHVDALVEDFLAAGNRRMPIAQWCTRYGYNVPADANLAVVGFVGMVDTGLGGGPYTLEEAKLVGRDWLDEQGRVVELEIESGNLEAASYPVYYEVKNPEGLVVYRSGEKPELEDETSSTPPGP